MSDVVIRAENLGKKYIIGHQAAEGGRGYTALRDVLMQNARGLWHKTKDLMQGNAIIQGDTYEEVWALRDLNFEIRQGEAVGIIGRNGAGKSTLLKILSRITEPSAGRVTIHGRVACLLEVGTGFHPELSGRENIYLNGAILGMSRQEIKSKFDEIVDFAGVERFLDTPVKRYSSGMYVRLAFAVAAHLEPEILVVDEVLAVGDAAFQKKSLGKMKEVSTGGRTVLFVSHNMAAIKSMCTTSILLNAGKIAAYGATDEVIDCYQERLVYQASAELILPSPPQQGIARAISLRFYNSQGELSTQFQMREPWRIQLEFETYEFVPNFIAAIGITNFDSLPLITYWSKPSDLPPGQYRVDFECQLLLNACNLRFVVGLSDGKQSIQHLTDVGVVTIEDTAVGEQFSHRVTGTGLLIGPPPSLSSEVYLVAKHEVGNLDA